MKKSILSLLLCILLLCGCGAGFGPEAAASPPDAAEAAPSGGPGYYAPESPLEPETDGAVRCYPLSDLNSTSAIPLGENILVFACAETSTTLTLLSGETLYPTASTELSMALTSSSPSLHIFDGGFSFFDESTRETVVLDNMLREIRRIPAPEDLIGTPILSGDCATLYYCTSDSLRALDLESRISRCLREISYSLQSLEGLWLNDTLLECCVFNENVQQTLFLSTQTGQLFGSADENLSFQASADSYYAAYWDGQIRRTLFGTTDGPTQELTPPAEVLDTYFLPELHAAITLAMKETGDICLEYYKLDTGFRTSRLTLANEYSPWDFHVTADGRVCFLNYDAAYGCNVLHIWDTSKTLTGEDAIYTGGYYTKESPDYEALAECQLYAQEIGEKYGIEVLIYQDAVAVEPWDYDMELEYLTGVINRELALLDEHLANYPEGFLSALANRYNGLKICIVRSLTGSAESGSLDSADGIQFLENYTAYVALAAPTNTEYALYHEMCHLIDTVVITESGAYDRWDELNPSGFAYDYDYVANATRNSSAYLQDSRRYFIDNYSMSFPKEDRARIMEYAMTEGNEGYFQSATMQAKLRLLCEGIREAFALEKSPETFLWEQYLNVSLAYTK